MGDAGPPRCVNGEFLLLSPGAGGGPRLCLLQSRDSRVKDVTRFFLR